MASWKKTLSNIWDKHGADIIAGTAGGVAGYFAPDLITDDPTDKTRYTSAGLLAVASIAANRGIAKAIDKGAQDGIGSAADKAQGFLHGLKTFFGNDGGPLEANKDAASGFRWGRALNPLSSWDTALALGPAYAGLTYGKGMWDSKWAPKLDKMLKDNKRWFIKVPKDSNKKPQIRDYVKSHKWRGISNPWHGGLAHSGSGKLSLLSTKRLGTAAILAYMLHAGLSSVKSTPYSE